MLSFLCMNMMKMVNITMKTNIVFFKITKTNVSQLFLILSCLCILFISNSDGNFLSHLCLQKLCDRNQSSSGSGHLIFMGGQKITCEAVFRRSKLFFGQLFCPPPHKYQMAAPKASLDLIKLIIVNSLQWPL